MVWQAAAIAAGAAIAGGLMSNRAQKKQLEQERALQREFAQNSIQWRTADAKKAGLHPLYAMGATGASYSPQTYYDSLGPAVAQAGQHIATGYQNAQTRKDQQAAAGRSAARANSGYAMQYRQMLNQERALNSQLTVDEAQANYFNSMAARNMQGWNASQDGLGLATHDQASDLQDSGLVRVEPKELVTNEPGSPSIEAGQNPLWVKEKAGRGFTGVRLNDEAAEAYGDQIAPLINLAATAYFYVFDRLPKAGKQNIKALLSWYKHYQNTTMKNKVNNPDVPAIRRVERFGLPKPRKLR
ncbi:MAG: DNA pilot protein [Microviridae sp.]|nr:MAG: DNA pilot protein [Microviridae sp.]